MPLFSELLAQRRHATIARHVRGDVLDLGCGNARTFEYFGSRLSSYCGIEREAEQIDYLRERFPEAMFLCRDLDSERLDLPATYDCIVMTAIIEHLFNQRFVMEQVADALRPGGVVLATTPTPLGNDLVHKVGAAIGLFAKSAVEDHIVIYNRHRFQILAREVGLHLRYHRYFQLFCNQIAVLEKPPEGSESRLRMEP